MMRHLFNGHIYLGRLASREDDEFIGEIRETVEVRPTHLRWFCGMNDLGATFICQAL